MAVILIIKDGMASTFENVFPRDIITSEFY